MPKGITAEQVYGVCDRLAAEGKVLTIRMIRQALGDTGSISTIWKHAANWRESKVPKPAANPNVPQEVSASIIAWVEQACGERIKALEDKVGQYQKSVAEKDEAIKSLQNEAERLKKEVDLLEREKKILLENVATVESLKTLLPVIKADMAEAKQGVARLTEAFGQPGQVRKPMTEAERSRQDVKNAKRRADRAATRVAEAQGSPA